jgi:hypothetical protein
MVAQEIDHALDGILAATREVLGPAAELELIKELPSNEDELFGTQLMEPLDPEIRDKPQPPITMETTATQPAPTFSGRPTKVKDDGGTGPEDEAQKIVLI